MTLGNYSGFFGGALAQSIIYPLEILKYRAQAGDSNIKFTKLVSNCQQIYSSHGVKGLYSGASVSIFASAVSWGSYFPIYNYLKSSDTLSIFNENEKTKNFTAGFLAGIPVLTLTNPFWVIKTQMALQYTNDLKGLRKTIKNIIKNDGLKGFYRGYLPGIFNCLHGGVQLWSYEYLKSWQQNETTLNSNLGFGAAFLTGFSLGFLSKIIATTILYPVQTVRVRLQDQNRSYRSLPSVLSSITREYGVLGMYRGLLIQLVLRSPMSAIIFAVYESCMTL